MKKHTYPNQLTIAALLLVVLSALTFAQASVLNNKAVKMPKPVLPPAARAVGAFGAVNVQITVDETGKVVSATAVSGHPLLRNAAETAAMHAEFEPFVQGGKAVKTSAVLFYDFNPNAKNDDNRVSYTEKPVNPVPPKTQKRSANGVPTAAEIKAMLEEKFTSIYEDHFCCKEKNKVEFEWLAPVEVGGQRTLSSVPVPCWVARIDVKVTFTKRSSGETKSVRRGINGNPVKEGFCIYKGAYDEWTYSTYAP